MSFSLGELPDGDLAIVSDETLPADIKRIEYYRSQRLFMLVYDLPDHEGDLMHYELKTEIADKVQRRSSLVVIEPDKTSGKPSGYYASLIQVGRIPKFCSAWRGLGELSFSYLQFINRVVINSPVNCFYGCGCSSGVERNLAKV
jgi:hypothetical protein